MFLIFIVLEIPFVLVVSFECEDQILSFCVRLSIKCFKDQKSITIVDTDRLDRMMNTFGLINCSRCYTKISMLTLLFLYLST